jgi:uncharacterized membrane protein YdjX (TVP38/TMEM64 family)
VYTPLAMKARRILALVAFPALFAAIIALGILFRREIFMLFGSSQRLRAWIGSAGVLAPLLFMAVQALQVVVFFVPGEIPQVAGGYLFGVWKGSLLSLAGITAGATFNFVMARLLGVPFVHALFARERVDRIRRLADLPRARLSFFLVFLIPGIPKDILCYAAGLSSLGLPSFLIFSTLGRAPGILGSALLGEAAAGKRWLLAGALLALAVVLFVIGFLLRDRIQAALERLARRRRRGLKERPGKGPRRAERGPSESAGT